MKDLKLSLELARYGSAYDEKNPRLSSLLFSASQVVEQIERAAKPFKAYKDFEGRIWTLTDLVRAVDRQRRQEWESKELERYKAIFSAIFTLATEEERAWIKTAVGRTLLEPSPLKRRPFTEYGDVGDVLLEEKIERSYENRQA